MAAGRDGEGGAESGESFEDGADGGRGTGRGDAGWVEVVLKIGPSGVLCGVEGGVWVEDVALRQDG